MDVDTARSASEFVSENIKAILAKIKKSINNKRYERIFDKSVDGFKIYIKPVVSISFGVTSIHVNVLYLLPHSMRDTNLGYAASLLYTNTQHIIGMNIFTKHFFERYRLRSIKDESMPMGEVVRTFFKDNDPYLNVALPGCRIENEKYKGGDISVLNDGISISMKHTLDDGRFIRKAVTFLSFDMLTEYQNINKKMCLAMRDFSDYNELLSSAVESGYPLPVIKKIHSMVEKRHEELKSLIKGFDDSMLF